MTHDLIFSGLVAFAVCALLLWILEPVSHRIGLIDNPGGRKAHRRPTPLIGGIAMFIAFSLAVLSLDVPLSGYRLLFAGALILVVVGVLDDLHELSATHRFVAQITAGLLMAAGAAVQLQDFGQLIWPGHILALGILAVPVTVFATVGVINAVNMADGLDGLAASLVLITISALGIIAWSADELRAVGILCLACGCRVRFSHVQSSTQREGPRIYGGRGKHVSRLCYRLVLDRALTGNRSAFGTGHRTLALCIAVVRYGCANAPPDADWVDRRSRQIKSTFTIS